jgi:hypothetical protein
MFLAHPPDIVAERAFDHSLGLPWPDGARLIIADVPRRTMRATSIRLRNYAHDGAEKWRSNFYRWANRLPTNTEPLN